MRGLPAAAIAVLLPAMATAAVISGGRAAGPSALRLDREGASWSVRAISAAASSGTAVDLPANAHVESFVEIPRGWLLAAAIPSPERRELRLVAGDGNGVRVLPSPRYDAGRLRENAVFLTRGGILSAVAWFEGERRESYALRIAAWSGDGWSAPATVSPPGRGTQIALAATELSDGSSLLVWSAFDGRADQILYARCRGAECTPAERIGSRSAQPEITPAIASVGDGALAVWSRREGGEYRLVAARYANGRWSDPGAVAGPGSVYPTLDGHGNGAYLLFRDARAAAWTFAETDAQGVVLRRAEWHGGTSEERPVVGAVEPDGVTLWLSNRTEHAAWR